MARKITPETPGTSLTMYEYFVGQFIAHGQPEKLALDKAEKLIDAINERYVQQAAKERRALPGGGGNG